MAATLLTVMLMVPYICEGALLRKSSATDFLQKVREKRASECFTGGCSTEIGEAGEVLEANMGFVDNPNLMAYNGATAKREINLQRPGGEAVVDGGSGM